MSDFNRTEIISVSMLTQNFRNKNVINSSGDYQISFCWNMDGTFRCLLSLSSQKYFISSLALQYIQAYFLPHHAEEQISVWEDFQTFF